VLAAGAASRFGSPKQQLLLAPVLDRVRASDVDDIVVVIGAYQVETEERTVKCAEWERGPGASLRCGLEALGDDVEAAVVVLADGPSLDPRAVNRVISAWRAGSGPVVAATYGGQRLHPVLIDRSAWREVPDEGLRNVPAAAVECGDLAPPGDVDSPADLR
jgi:CTP:molybdopterin cytidylyltransferase MocA